MASGGARATSGPPPDPMALRRDRPSDQAGWTTLPLGGRVGDPPPWPLPPSALLPEELAERERDVWLALWDKPQAVQWERLGLDHEVALYVRRAVEAEQPGASVALGTLVRQLGEALGLTPVGMLRLRWRMEVPAPAKPAPSTSTATSSAGKPAPRRKPPRRRLTVIGDGQGA